MFIINVEGWNIDEANFNQYSLNKESLIIYLRVLK